MTDHAAAKSDLFKILFSLSTEAEVKFAIDSKNSGFSSEPNQLDKMLSDYTSEVIDILSMDARRRILMYLFNECGYPLLTDINSLTSSEILKLVNKYHTLALSDQTKVTYLKVRNWYLAQGLMKEKVEKIQADEKKMLEKRGLILLCFTEDNKPMFMSLVNNEPVLVENKEDAFKYPLPSVTYATSSKLEEFYADLLYPIFTKIPNLVNVKFLMV